MTAAACAAWLLACRWGAFDPSGGTAGAADAGIDGVSTDGATERGDAGAPTPPHPIANGANFTALGAYDGRLYWLGSDGVYGCTPVPGPCVAQRFAREDFSCSFGFILRVGRAGVVWEGCTRSADTGSNSATVKLCPLGDTCSSAIDLGGFAQGQAYAFLALEGDALYVSPMVPPSEVETCTLPSCTWTVLTQSPTQLGAIAADQSSFYFAATPAVFFEGGTGPSLYACPLAGCTQAQWTTVWTAQGAPTDTVTSLIATAGQLWWPFQDSVMSVACTPTGCSSGVVSIAGQYGAYGMASDGESVYWANSRDGRVMKCAVSGCGNTPVELANGQATPSVVAVDATNVYWMNQASGEIWTASK
jgi:hypothetical protein